MSIVSPVIQRASLEARKVTTPPMSSGSARRLDNAWCYGVHADAAKPTMGWAGARETPLLDGIRSPTCKRGKSPGELAKSGPNL